jgi:hypothetical protein
MRPATRTLRQAVVVFSASCLAACSTLFGPNLVVKPVKGAPWKSSYDARYDSAVSAIGDRDYGRALEYLQQAKERNAKDARVLNALGVVYDKLGRFDLSARYYAEAVAADPQSRIVAANLTYSHALQAMMAGGPIASSQPVSVADGDFPQRMVVTKAATVAAPQIHPTLPKLDLPQLDRPESRLALIPIETRSVPIAATQATASPRPAPEMSVRHGVVLTGYPLVIANGTGHKDLAEPVRRQLAVLGWAIAQPSADLPQLQKVSVITYPASSLAVARGLARTLAFPVKLEANSCRCGGLKLALGADFTGWKAPETAGYLRNAVSLAAIAIPRDKGAR